ncbi:MAG TPA: tetratricopeptide repeat protein [Chthoniobacterales bacterium]|jgi:TolB-like protein/class 3 adenylate cyclase|nr:tetratricopeptide repeat protein [Chthoniobacterales bacterium]
MSDELENDAQLEIGHVLFIDIVGFSKLLVDQQSAATQRLNQIVRSSEQFRADEAGGKLIRLPTGDGVVLVFFSGPEAPGRCAMQIARALKTESFGVRMGIHSGPVNRVADVDERANLAGSGINLAQRVMDCGDAGHILVSRRVAEDLEQHSRWRPRLHHLGQFEVKHGHKIDIVNLHDAEVGNAALPSKLKGKRVAAKTSRTKWIVAGVVVVVLISIVGWLVQRRMPAPETKSIIVPEKSVAILPFKPLSSQNRDEALENGMADTLIAKLSTVAQIVIPSLTSAQKFLEQEHDPIAAARLLHVHAVLDGTLQKTVDRIRVTVRLINVADGVSLWSAQFDEKFDDVFTVEDTIAQKVANALAVQLTGEDQKRLTKRYTQNTEAYQLYLKGRFYWNKYTEDSYRKSIELYKQAVEKDPNYALAYAGIADSYSLIGELGIGLPQETFSQARAYAQKALNLDDQLSEAHLSLGIVKLFYDWDPPAAEPELARAKQLNPNDPQVYHFYGHYLEYAGRFDDAASEIKRGVDLDPTNLVVSSEYAWTFSIRHRVDEAIALYKKVLELDPNFLLASVWLAQSYEEKGMYAEAMAELERVRKIDNWAWIVAEIGCVDAKSGKRDEAHKVIEELKARAAHEYIDETLIVYIYADLGERDEAFAWMNKGYQSRAGNLPWLQIDPKFDPLRSDPRFGEFVRRIFGNNSR